MVIRDPPATAAKPDPLGPCGQPVRLGSTAPLAFGKNRRLARLKPSPSRIVVYNVATFFGESLTDA
jgi:hypothetical protein